jgi:hypothetical protein
MSKATQRQIEDAQQQEIDAATQLTQSDGKRRRLNFDGLVCQITRSNAGSVNTSFYLRRKGKTYGIDADLLVAARRQVAIWEGKWAEDPNFNPNADKAQKRQAKDQARAARVKAKRTLYFSLERHIQKKEPQWRGRYHAKNRRTWVRKYVPAKIGNKHYANVTQIDIASILQTIKPLVDTAWDVMYLLRGAIGYAMYETQTYSKNPADWKKEEGGLANDPDLQWMLEEDGSKRVPMRWQDIHEFYSKYLLRRGTMPAWALQLLIFTVVRPHNICEVIHDEFNKRQRGPEASGTEIWTIPADKMKVPRRNDKPSPHPAFLGPKALRLVNEEMRYKPKVLRGYDARFKRLWKNQKPTLTDEECETIRNWDPAVPDHEIAKIYNRNPRNIAMIRSGTRRPPKVEERIPAPARGPEQLVFYGNRTSKGVEGQIGPGEMRRLMRAINDTRELETGKRFLSDEGEEPTPHGFRGTFKTWAHEVTTFSNEVIETHLAHRNAFVKEEDAHKAEKRRDQMAGTYFSGKYRVERATLAVMWEQFVTTGSVGAEFIKYLKEHARDTLIVFTQPGQKSKWQVD